MPHQTAEKPFDFPQVPNRIDLTLDSVGESSLPIALKEWARVWHALLEDGQKIPAKNSLRMSRLGALLPHMIIFEKAKHDAYTIRLAGTAVEAWMDRKLTGLDPLTLVPEAQRRRVANVYNLVTEQPCGFYISEAVMFSRGKQAQVTTLKLPFTDDQGAIRFFLAAYQFSEGEYVTSESNAAAAEHRRVDQIGYIDIGFGTPT